MDKLNKNFEPLKKLLKKKGLELTELHEVSLNVSEKNGVCIYNYNNNVLVPRNDPIICMCRGIGINLDGEIVNHPFDRFFNYHEPECDKVDIENADILEKLDGSLISCWFNGGEWEVTTRGAFYPHEDSHNFKETFKRLFDSFEHLQKDFCYMFELISRDNRIVTRYDDEFVGLIGRRNLETMRETGQPYLDKIAKTLNVRRPKRYKARNVEECRKLFDNLKDDEEGLVVVDKDFKRFKLKQESYLKMAKIISLKNQDVLDYMLGRVDLDSDFTDMPELTEKVEEVKKLFDEVKDYADMIYDNIKQYNNQKEFAMHALNYKIGGVLFKLKQGKKFEELDIRWKRLEEYHKTIIKPKRKKILVMRAIPSSGKSTWIKENNLARYTLCADTLRLMFAAPNPKIPQEYNNRVWGMLYEILEERMKRGDFTVIDGTNTTEKSLKKYKKLAEKYGYEMNVISIHVDLDEALNRNRRREEYKKVPEDVITRMYAQLNLSNQKGL